MGGGCEQKGKFKVHVVQRKVSQITYFAVVEKQIVACICHY